MDELLDDISDKIFLEKLKTEFFTSVKMNLKKIDDALSSGRFEEIRKIAHDIKGTSGVFGFHEGTGLAADLMSRIDDGDDDQIIAACSILSSYLKSQVLGVNPEVL